MNASFPTGGGWDTVIAAAAGAVVGWIVADVANRLVAGGPVATRGGGRGGRAAAGACFAIVAAGLWWWEVSARGQVPLVASSAGIPWTALAWRWGGHLVFIGFLVAAMWIDIRDRVIPDAITLPGVLSGLAWAGLRPDSLPPVVRAVPRSFAAPLLEPDVLGLCGPLGDAALPGWLGAAPAISGLTVAIALFVAWWLGCTAPPDPDPAGRRPFDPRLPVLAAGLVGIGAAWWRGGDHWQALLSALAGMAVGMAVVWATRLGASRALGREAVGFGDVTLMAFVGAWLGWQAAVLTCCLGVLVGLVYGIVQFVLSRDNELPFGPGLGVGAVLVVVLWRPIWGRVAPGFDRPLEIAALAAAVIVLTALTLAAWWRVRGRVAA